MVLLGINCGFSNTDCASLPQSALDLGSGWMNFPRPKTEILRRIPSWPETVELLRNAISLRPKPSGPADSDLCFLTVQSNRWVRTTPSQSTAEKYITASTIARRVA